MIVDFNEHFIYNKTFLKRLVFSQDFYENAPVTTSSDYKESHDFNDSNLVSTSSAEGTRNPISKLNQCVCVCVCAFNL